MNDLNGRFGSLYRSGSKLFRRFIPENERPPESGEDGCSEEEEGDLLSMMKTNLSNSRTSLSSTMIAIEDTVLSSLPDIVSWVSDRVVDLSQYAYTKMTEPESRKDISSLSFLQTNTPPEPTNPPDPTQYKISSCDWFKAWKANMERPKSEERLSDPSTMKPLSRLSVEVGVGYLALRSAHWGVKRCIESVIGSDSRSGVSTPSRSGAALSLLDTAFNVVSKL